MAQRILDTMNRYQKIKEDIANKYYALNRDSTPEQVSEFLTFVIQSGFREIILDAIMNIENKIDECIAHLEEELKEL